MGIVRHGPVQNFDTGTNLILTEARSRFTRGQAHRLLNHRGITHNPNLPMKDMLFLLEQHQIPPSFVPPGNPDAKLPGPPPVKTVEELPNNVPKLRQLCLQRGVKFKREDTKLILQARLRGEAVG